MIRTAVVTAAVFTLPWPAPADAPVPPESGIAHIQVYAGPGARLPPRQVRVPDIPDELAAPDTGFVPASGHSASGWRSGVTVVRGRSAFQPGTGDPMAAVCGPAPFVTAAEVGEIDF